MSNRRFERLFGSNGDDPVVFEGDGTRAERTGHAYGQWYETDRTRLGEECGLLTEAGIKFECRRMPDARLSFICQIAEHPVAFICPYSYPIAPPEAFHVGALESPAISDGSGRIDLFSDGDFTWSAERYVLDVVQKIEGMLLTDLHRRHERPGESHASPGGETVPGQGNNAEAMI